MAVDLAPAALLIATGRPVVAFLPGPSLAPLAFARKMDARRYVVASGLNTKTNVAALMFSADEAAAYLFCAVGAKAFDLAVRASTQAAAISLAACALQVVHEAPEDYGQMLDAPRAR